MEVFAPAASADALCPRPPVSNLAGSWIWVPAAAGLNPRNSYAYFRRTFTAAGSLVLHIAADTTYELHVDGKLLDRGTAPADMAYKSFDTHAVRVGAGRHVVAVLVHHLGQPCATAMQSRPGLFVHLVSPQGAPVVSDATWKTLPAAAYQPDLPCMMSHFGFYEVCDHGKIPRGWTALEFDDSDWPAAEVIGPAGCRAWPRLIPRDIPLLATTTLAAKKIAGQGHFQAGPISGAERDLTPAVEMAARIRRPTPTLAEDFPLVLAPGAEGQYVTLDFGREVTGHVRLEFAGACAGQRVDLGYDEVLDARGLPNPRRTYVHFADRAFLHEGQTTWQIYGARGFRYLLVDVEAGRGGLTLVGARVDERVFPLTRQGRFRCSDARLDRLYQVGLDTTRLCMLDTFVDCPSRERVLWMDFAIEARCASYGFGTTELWRRCLFLFAQNVCREGVLAGAIKGFVPTDSEPMLVSYTLGAVLTAAEYHLHSGDREACVALFPTLLKQFELIRKFTTPDGLVNEKWPGWGTFLDWSAMDFGGVSSCNNALYLQAQRATARLARSLGYADCARQFEEQADELAVTCRRKFWSESDGLFVDALYDDQPSAVRSQLANVMAIWAGLTSGSETPLLLDKILDGKTLLPRKGGDFRLRPGFKCQTGGLVPIGTPSAGALLTQVLFEHGRGEAALAYLRDNWIPISRSGTFSEHFVEDTNTSHCHGWSAMPVVQLPAYILGVRPVAAGWSEVEIAPQSAGLDWAEGTVPAPQGDIHVKWRRVGGQLQVDYQVPEGIKVRPTAIRS